MMPPSRRRLLHLVCRRRPPPVRRRFAADRRQFAAADTAVAKPPTPPWGRRRGGTADAAATSTFSAAATRLHRHLPSTTTSTAAIHHPPPPRPPHWPAACRRSRLLIGVGDRPDPNTVPPHAVWYRAAPGAVGNSDERMTEAGTACSGGSSVAMCWRRCKERRLPRAHRHGSGAAESWCRGSGGASKARRRLRC
ncbi:Os01g0346400 [Oryza sativa Japonica Group]|uniref:Os01g0346400 protein n=3 Tax=Oryza sativa TaxID=4530 RepID=C7IW86_ORYSJ|nr:hypothetical protein OsI_30955 [Oryza sativa Indica Group]EEE54515.1 hypothetical protein OsJ_01658 [Oryza sativa Japonica Group]BAH91052.1 Os01g0346400 [Oryza sativa Japonica Group]BAS71996.1 Os01g0346400 [Oryza sativa Japonica Group]|eukprot:NP_001172322.1 Os01g0346400 [Oryza sativa Japonica Group]